MAGKRTASQILTGLRYPGKFAPMPSDIREEKKKKKPHGKVLYENECNAIFLLELQI